MLLLQVLDEMTQALGERFDELGWDCPAVLFSLTMDVADEGVTYRADPMVVLEGHPAVALIRHHARIDAEAIGAAVVCEAWGYSPAVAARHRAGESIDFPPSQDPDRVELRLVTLVLRDGTETAVSQPRGGEPTTLDGGSRGWIPFLLRRVVGVASGAEPPSADLALRVAALWQLATLGVLVEQGFELPATVAPGDLARFSLPGLGTAAEGVRAAWWTPLEAALEGAELDVVALAAGLRAAVAEEGGALPVTAPPFTRGRDQAQADAEVLAWMDDALLGAYVDEVVPSGAELVALFGTELGSAWGAALAERLADGSP